jgi:hypothetical protein
MSPRPTVLATAAIAATLAAFRWWPASAPPDAAAPAPPPAATGAVVVSAGPLVERSSSGGAGWIPARPGDALGLADAIRTGHGDTAEVSLGRGTILLIDERSEVTVRELDAAAQRVQLARGRIGVEHRSEGTRVLRVEDGSGTILASSVGGRWSAVASRDSLAVAAREGAVRLESAGAAVDVPAGSQSAAWRGAAPLPARPVPTAVLLRVAHVLAERRRSTCTTLQVDAASEVRVNGEPVAVAPDGRVVVRVAEHRRRLPVEVEVRHVTGAVKRQRLSCAALDDAELRGWVVRWE